jgi:hypothetical protein
MTMNIAMITLLGLALPLSVVAHDGCPADAGHRAAAGYRLEMGRRLEEAGNRNAALQAYLLALDYDCEDRNGVGAGASRRAVPLARQLGREKEAAGELLIAYAIYEGGGLFADADRTLTRLVADGESGAGLQSLARIHFQLRLDPDFAAANRLKLQAAGPYVASREPLERMLRTLEANDARR